VGSVQVGVTEGRSTPGSEVRYSAIIDRPRLEWPGGARVALWVALNLEHYQYLPPHNAYIDPWPRVPQAPDTLMYGYYDYANRAGLWRLLEVLDRYRIPVTASLNAAVLDHYPEVREAIVSRGWTVMCHGVYNTEYLFGLDEAAETAFFRDITGTVERHTGRPLRGLLGPAGSVTPNTMRLMAAHGLTYSADWALDDQPFPIDVPTGRLVGVPYGFDVNDDGMMALGYGQAGYDAEDFVEISRDQFEVLYAEGADSGRVMCLGLHAYVFGHPHRIEYLDRTFDHLLSHDGVWLTTAEAIADHYLEHAFDEQLALLREAER
jgi:peptidoglycan/xylan/chitin deacetylase (PgdA/CDA1 family)